MAGGAEDRPAPPAGADRVGGRAARAEVDVEDRYGPLPEAVTNLFTIQEAKLKLARAGADYSSSGGAWLSDRSARSDEPALAAGRDHTRLLDRQARGDARSDSFDAALVLLMLSSTCACSLEALFNDWSPS